jgi:hypothetical protein
MGSRLFTTWSFTRPWSPGELRELSRAGYRGIRITDRVELDPFFANLLRHAAAAGLRVLWRGQVPADLVPRVRHLSPPYDTSAGPMWRRPGPLGLAVRYGPGFAVVEDHRSGRYQRSVLQAADGRHRLLKDEGVRRAARLDHVLAEEGLVFLMNGWAVSLPIPVCARLASC